MAQDIERVAVETLTLPTPSGVVARTVAESLALPVPSGVVARVWVEVLSWGLATANACRGQGWINIA